MADPAIQYDGGLDTSVLAPARLTGSGNAPSGDASPKSVLDAVYDPTASKNLQSGLAAAMDKKIGAEDNLDSWSRGQLQRDRDRQEKAYNLESAQLDDPALTHPWNADQERAKRTTDPFQAFGSIGSVFGIIASSFTKTPLVSALNASGAAMTAIHQGDQEAYKSAYEAWKSNSELAVKRFNMEREMFEDANKLSTNDLARWSVERNMIANRFQDVSTQQLLAAGMYGPVLEADAKRVSTAVQFQEAQDKLGTKLRHLRSIQDLNAADDKEHTDAEGQLDPKWANSKERYAQRLQNVLQVTQAEKGVSKPPSPDQQFAQSWWAEHPEGTAEEFGAAFGQYNQDKKPAGKGTPAQQFAAKWWAEHPDGTSEQFGQAFGQFQQGQKPPSQQRLSWGAEHAKNVETVMEGVRRDHPDWPEDKVTEEALGRVAQAQRGKQLSPEAIDRIAEARLAGDTSGMTNIGRDNAVRVMQRSAEMLAARGQGGESLKNADVGYQGERAAARTAGTRASNIAISAIDARKLAPLALETSEKVWRTSNVPFNRLIQSAEKAGSDTDLYKFKDATQAFLNAYVATISRTGVPTDRVRDQADKMLDTAYSAETYRELMKFFDREMKAAESAPMEYFQMVSKGGLTGSSGDKGIIQEGRDGKRYRFKGANPDQMSDKSQWELVQ